MSNKEFTARQHNVRIEFNSNFDGAFDLGTDRCGVSALTQNSEHLRPFDC